jgi:hypothetical protein
MAKSTFDKKDGKSKKRGRPKKAASEENAKAEESGGEPAAAEKAKRTKKTAAERAAEKEEEAKQAAKGARKALRKAVKKKVFDESIKIAETLVDKMIEGNMRSTAVVLSMIEKKQKDDEGLTRHGGLTAADLLGSEEEWDGETENAGTREEGLRD